MKHLGRTSSDAEALMKSLDADGDGVVSYDELASAYSLQKITNSREEMRVRSC